MNEIFPKIDHKFYSNVTIHSQTNEYVSYYITTHFITSNKDYNFCRCPHSVNQTYS